MPAFDCMVFLSPFPWEDKIQQTTHHAARYFATRLPVLYVERPPVWSPQDGNFEVKRLGRVYLGRRLRQVAPNIHVLTPKSFPFGATSLGRQINDSYYARDVSRALNQVGAEALFMAFYYEESNRHLKLIEAHPVVYYCLDFFAQEAERTLTRRADAVLACSQVLCDEKRQLNPHTYWVPNGYDLGAFSDSPFSTPNDLAVIPRPRLGLAALYTHHLDYDLLLKLAQRRKDCSLVLIGPLGRGQLGPDKEDQVAIRRLRSHTNVYWLGYKKHAAYPQYVKGFDVGLLPLKDDPFNRGRDPGKIYQYLAAGIPVVTTPLNGLLSVPPSVHTARNPDEFCDKIELALQEKLDTAALAERSRFVRGAAWSERFRSADRALDAVFPGWAG